MENRTPDVTRRDDDKSPDQIEREMEQTRESITEKVSLLENQVLGTVHAVTDSAHAVKDAVTAAPSAVSTTVKETVEAVKETLAAAPSAVKETLRETVNAVKDTVKETVGSFDASACIQRNPWAALGTSTGAGFLVGYFLLGGGRSSGGGLFGRPLMARGDDAPASGGRVGGSYTPHNAATHAAASHSPGLFDGLFDMVGREVRQLAEAALATGLASLKENISTQVPKVVESTVQRLTEQVTQPHGAAGDGTTRVNGPDYAARG